MASQLTAKKTVSIKAPSSRVWDALTDPKVIKQYFFGTEATTDWKEGSPIVFKGSWEGRNYVDKGTILKVEPQKELQFSYWSSLSGTDDKEENYSRVTYRLTNEKTTTVLTVMQDNCKTVESKNDSENNWKLVLDNLKNIVEKAR